MSLFQHIIESVFAVSVVAMSPALAHAQSVVHPTPKDTVILMNGKPKSGTISDAQGQMMFVVSDSGTHVMSVDGERVKLGSPQEKAAIARVNAALAAFEKNGAAATPAAESATATSASSPVAPVAAAASTPGVEFGSAGRVTVHRETSTVELIGDKATVTFTDTPIPFEMQYKHDGVGGGLLRSASRGGRSLATSGWSFSMSGRQMYDSRNGGTVPGGNGGSIMKAARELLAAIDEAQAQGAKSGQSYTPVGRDALHDLINAHQ